MIDLLAKMAAIEASARKANLRIIDFCEEAGIATSNWSRWKSGTSPTFSK
jgi:hypothetical protein